jgi:hypothetical protein
VLDWTLENLSADDVARLRAMYEPLTESVRALIDATIRTDGAPAQHAGRRPVRHPVHHRRRPNAVGQCGDRRT